MTAPWPFPPPDFQHPRPGQRIPFNPDNHEDAPWSQTNY